MSAHWKVSFSIKKIELPTRSNFLRMNNYEKKKAAREMYFRGLEIKEIAGLLKLHENTVQTWQKEGEWKKTRDELIEDTVIISMKIITNIYRRAHEISEQKDFDPDELNKCAKAIEQFAPKKSDVVVLSEIGKYMTLYFLEKNTDKNELNEFIDLFRDFSSWYIDRK